MVNHLNIAPSPSNKVSKSVVFLDGVLGRASDGIVRFQKIWHQLPPGGQIIIHDQFLP